MRQQKISWLLSVCLFTAALVLPAWAQNNTSSAASQSLPPNDLTTGLKNQLITAGFKNVETIAATANKFLPPVYYFRVQTTSTNPAWGDAVNVVAILISNTTDITWLYNKGDTEVVDLAGRTQVRTSNLGQYIVVTGPERDKLVLLSHNLKVLQ